MIIDNEKNKFEKTSIESVDSIKLKNIGLIKDEKKILDNITLSINKGEKICLVGQSGSGKTSLISLLSGFNEQSEGEILINDEVTNLKNVHWSNNISYISQFPYIFPDTIRNNILFYSNENISEDHLKEISKLVGLDKFISTLPQGYDTNIGEGGQELSGGQAQRIAIARALISNREVIILDEPTSHLDIETEFEIKEKLLELFKGRTVIIATHRLHWLNNVDYVLNLEQGKVSDFEKVAEFKNSPRFAELKANLVGGSYSEQ